MKATRVVTLANDIVRLQFLAMERSLRATGCDLPLHVIPYDESRFPLPKNAEWLEDDELFALVHSVDAVPLCRKYLAFTVSNSAFFDCDIIHIRDPRVWLAPLPEDVFVVADTEWNKTRWTFTKETGELYAAKTTLWLLDNFNSGFFAQGNALVSFENIKTMLTDPRNWKLRKGKLPSSGEQPGANLLIHQSGAKVINLCLPPYRMESTMAGDYPAAYESILSGPHGPAFIHYAGVGRNLDAPVARLIFEHLNQEEAAEMRMDFEKKKRRREREGRWPIWVRVASRIVSLLDDRFCIRWRDGV